uniref:Ig-like domain-containing protein n=1 Tax=uncultured Microbulbifer sp. TaxID=348147 RepID=UPI0025E23B7B
MLNNRLKLGVIAAAMLSAGHSHAAVDCTNLPEWNAASSYSGGALVQYNDNAYEANWWSNNRNPEQYSGQYQEWSLLGNCGSVTDPDPVPPTGSITAPLAGTTTNENDSVIIQVTAGDTDGQVVSVAFYVDGALIATDTAAPWEASWTAVAGTPILTAVISDNDALEITTAAVSITVEEPAVIDPVAPSVSLNTPTDGSSHTTGDNLSISASASDSDGAVSKVEFFVDGTLVATDTSAPYTTSWTATLGDHEISAVATDSDNLTASAKSSISVSDDSDPV